MLLLDLVCEHGHLFGRMQGKEIQGCSDRAANLEVKNAEQQEFLRYPFSMTLVTAVM